MAHPLEIANTFLEMYGQDGEITHMKLQKLVYMTHGYWLQSHDDPAVDQNPEVWTYGPVFSRLYRELRDTRNAPIRNPVLGDFDEHPRLVDDNQIRDTIERVWNKYGAMSAAKLSDLTHKEGSPWHMLAVRYNFRVPRGLEIPVEMVRNYYRAEIPPLPA